MTSSLMTPAEFGELRRICDRYLDGSGRVQDVARRFSELYAKYMEANYQAHLRGDPPYPDFVPAELTPDEKGRLIALLEASVDLSMPRVEWLPVDEDGAG